MGRDGTPLNSEMQGKPTEEREVPKEADRSVWFNGGGDGLNIISRCKCKQVADKKGKADPKCSAHGKKIVIHKGYGTYDVIGSHDCPGNGGYKTTTEQVYMKNCSFKNSYIIAEDKDGIPGDDGEGPVCRAPPGKWTTWKDGAIEYYAKMQFEVKSKDATW